MTLMPISDKLPKFGRPRTTQPPLPFATRQEILDRLRKDTDSLVIAVLDDLSFDIIRAYGYRPPKGYLDWIGSKATNEVRRLALGLAKRVSSRTNTHALLPDKVHPDNIRNLLTAWLRPQMERRFGTLPDPVNQVLRPSRTPNGESERSVAS